MNTKLYFLMSFAVGMILGSILLNKYAVAPVQAISPTDAALQQTQTTTQTQTNQPPRNQLVESAIYFTIYLMIMAAGTLIWKKVEAQKHQYKVSQPMRFHSI